MKLIADYTCINCKKGFIVLILSLLIYPFCIQTLYSQNQPLKSPVDYFGFIPGDEGMLFDYEQLIDYLVLLDHNSDRLELRLIGNSPLGKPMYALFISSESNIRNLDNLAQINKQLAINSEIPEQEFNQFMETGKVFFLATLSMHSTEVGPTQALPLIVWDLINTSDPDKIRWMTNVVYMAVPCHNPDGMDMVVNHYRKYKGTKYEISSLPGVYHKYIGHDNNRDFISLTQSDTRAISKLTSLEWFPQVMFEKHQMQSAGPRYFVPPNHDPIAENIDAIVWNWTGIFGSNLIKDLTRNGLSGVSQRYAFDNYWPGSTETCMWKNVIAMLTEAASTRLATSIYIEPNELRVSGKGLSDYKKSTNMPLPWPGGWWKLSDIINYEITSTLSIIETCSENRKKILELRNQLCKDEVERGRTNPPFYYILPADQHDKSEWLELSGLLQEHGVQVYSLKENYTHGNITFKAGDMVLPLSQPFRPFIKEVMEKQVYPVRRYSLNGEIIKPYDITSWSLPLHRGLSCIEINTIETGNQPILEHWDSLKMFAPIKEENDNQAFSCVLPGTENGSYRVIFRALSQGISVSRFVFNDTVNKEFRMGDFFIETESGIIRDNLIQDIKESKVSASVVRKPESQYLAPLTMKKIAIMETWNQDIDAGWTRFILDSYNIPFTILHPEDFEKISLEKMFDILIIPDNPKELLMTGKFKNALGELIPSSLPPQYAKGLGDKGFQGLLKFLDNGGIIIAIEQGSGLFEGPLKIGTDEQNSEEFMLPFKNISADIIKKGFDCPGSFLSVKLNKDHPLTLGMPEETGGFFRDATIFTTSIPGMDTDRRVIGTFPENNLLLSGYIVNENLASDKANMIWLRKGKGQLVVFGFNPIFRASTPATYKLFFNSLLLGK